ncbi:hypothetical protein [Klebsiella aerogenes]|uniref:hypothetical protein n=1 Tax=Klebsiella aerogenes TaxID=548 RepID=UPI0024136C7E|nr:hypothetical protein [Klebsiella aerogenes]MDG4539495.1 hypothetical protein [Klebsiella aerogenes]
MTDINRLLASLKRRSAHAKEFGDSITFVKLKDIDALVEALEKARAQSSKWLEAYHKAVLVGARYEERIAELEESHAQVIQSRDHYKRMSEEGLKQLAESRTVTVKLPNQTEFDDPLSAYEAIEKCKEALTEQGIKWEAE